VNRMGQALPALSASSEALTQSFNATGEMSHAWEQRMAAFPLYLDAVEAFHGGIQKGLAQITDDLSTAAEKTGHIRQHSETAAETIHGANALLAGAARLDGTIDSIQQRMSELLGAIGAINAAMHSTSQELQSFVVRSVPAVPGTQTSVASPNAVMGGLPVLPRPEEEAAS
jgi:methyl-accepting chemotaxis protein